MKSTLILTLAVLAVSGLGCGSGGATTSGGTAGTSAYSLSFDGVDDLAQTVGMYSINTFTIEAWVKPTSVTAPNMFRGIAGNKDSCILTQYDFTDGQWSVRACTPACTLLNSPAGNLTVGVWQHLAASYDGMTLSVYRNGVLVGSVAKMGDTLDFTGFVIGRWLTEGSFDGLIDEVRFWNIGRTQPQIAADMGSILTGLEAGLVGYWRCEEGAGQSAADGSPSANAAQLGSTGGVDADDPTWMNEGAPVS